MPSRGPLRPEEDETWQMRAEAQLTRLRSLTAAQLGAEVVRRGFADLPGDGERTRIGLSNSLCPDAPPLVGGDDINVVEQYNGLLVPVLSTLEDAGLLASEPRGRSALRFYRLTTRGRSALGDDGVETILAARSSWGRRRAGVNGHRFLPTGGHLIPHWWPSFLPAGGHQISPPVAIVSPQQGLGRVQVRGFTPLPAVACASR